MQKIEVKDTLELTDSEFRRCSDLTHGNRGYMQEMLYEYELESKVVLLKNGSGVLGWALLVPTSIMRKHPLITPHAKRNSKYCVQIYVGSYWRNRGYGKAIMDEVIKLDPKPFVFPNPGPSSTLYSRYDIVTTREKRGNLPKSVV